MSSRNTILQAIKANRPADKPLPVLNFELVTTYPDKLAQFGNVLASIGGEMIQHCDDALLLTEMQTLHEAGHLVFSTLPGMEFGDLTALKTAPPAALESVFKAYIPGVWGVAENGSIWVEETAMGNRLLPFICQHLVIVLDRDHLLDTMHHAYAQITPDREGFGMFLAGPSKTADIEQSIVIGAHGARSLRVLIK